MLTTQQHIDTDNEVSFKINMHNKSINWGRYFCCKIMMLGSSANLKNIAKVLEITENKAMYLLGIMTKKGVLALEKGTYKVKHRSVQQIS